MTVHRPVAVRLHSLDGLRGIAALSVVIHHALINGFPLLLAAYSRTTALPCCGPAWWLTNTPLHVFWLGTEDVYVFFVLSGIVLTLPFVRGRGLPWRRYYPSRLARLYLPVWASLIIAVLTVTVVPHLLGIQGSQSFHDRTELIHPRRLFLDAILVTGTSGINGVLWSLQWEVLFSLLLPLFVILAVKGQRFSGLKLAGVLAVTLVGATFTQFTTGLGPTPFFLPMFAVGSLMAAHLDRLRSFAESAADRYGPWFWRGVIVASVLLLSTYWLVMLLSPTQTVLNASRFVSFLGAILVVFTAAFHPGFRRLLESRPVQWLGVISFSLYLTHDVLIRMAVGLAPPSAAPIAAFTAAAVAIPFGWGFQRLIEAPAHRFSQRLKRRPPKPV